MFKIKKKDGANKKSRVKEILLTVAFVVFFRAFIVEPFNIPSGSMMPNLLIGDYLFVDKFTYGWNGHSILGNPKMLKKRMCGLCAPKRGDVVVFRLPSEQSVHYVKRLIGLPGDRVQMKGGVVFINGEPVPQIPSRTETVETSVGCSKTVQVFQETLDNGKSYEVLREAVDKTTAANDTEEFLVPEGHCFCLGDNRDNSADSRFSLRYVPMELIVGRPFLIFFSINSSILDFLKVSEWRQNVRLSRFLNYVGSV